MLSSSKQYLTSSVMASRTRDCPSLPSATARATTSRSVIIPTRLSFSPTGRKPTSSFAIRLAISSSVSFGLASRTLRVMTSATFIDPSPCLTRWTPAFGGQSILMSSGNAWRTLAVSASANMTLDDGEHGLDGSLGIHRLSSACEAVSAASYELLARTHRVRLNGRTILLVKSATYHQRQLGGKVGCVLNRQPVAKARRTTPRARQAIRLKSP